MSSYETILINTILHLEHKTIYFSRKGDISYLHFCHIRRGNLDAEFETHIWYKKA